MKKSCNCTKQEICQVAIKIVVLSIRKKNRIAAKKLFYSPRIFLLHLVRSHANFARNNISHVFCPPLSLSFSLSVQFEFFSIYECKFIMSNHYQNKKVCEFNMHINIGKSCERLAFV